MAPSRPSSLGMSKVLGLVLLATIAAAALVGVRAADLVELKGKGLEAKIFDVVSGEPKLKETVAIDHTKKLKAPLHVHESNELHIALDLALDDAKMKPQQRLLTLTHSERKGKVARVSGDITSAGSGAMVVTFVVTSDKLQKQIGTLGGAYDAEVVIADSRFKKSYKANFGSITVSHAQKADGSLASDPPLGPAEVAYAPKEEFEHIMRDPDSRPPAVVSLAFALVAMGPLLLLPMGLLGTGANLKKMSPKSGLFHLVVGATLGLIAVYWLSLKLQTALPLIAIGCATAMLCLRV